MGRSRSNRDQTRFSHLQDRFTQQPGAGDGRHSLKITQGPIDAPDPGIDAKPSGFGGFFDKIKSFRDPSTMDRGVNLSRSTGVQNEMQASGPELSSEHGTDVSRSSQRAGQTPLFRHEGAPGAPPARGAARGSSAVKTSGGGSGGASKVPASAAPQKVNQLHPRIGVVTIAGAIAGGLAAGVGGGAAGGAAKAAPAVAKTAATTAAKTVAKAGKSVTMTAGKIPSATTPTVSIGSGVPATPAFPPPSQFQGGFQSGSSLVKGAQTTIPKFGSGDSARFGASRMGGLPETRLTHTPGEGPGVVRSSANTPSGMPSTMTKFNTNLKKFGGELKTEAINQIGGRIGIDEAAGEQLGAKDFGGAAKTIGGNILKSRVPGFDADVIGQLGQKDFGGAAKGFGKNILENRAQGGGNRQAPLQMPATEGAPQRQQRLEEEGTPGGIGNPRFASRRRRR